MQQKGIVHILLLLGTFIGVALVLFSIFFVYPRFQVFQTLKFFYEPRSKSQLMDRLLTDRKVSSNNPTGESISDKDISFISSWGKPTKKTEDRNIITLQFPQNIRAIIFH